jgi:hypothetical protein
MWAQCHDDEPRGHEMPDEAADTPPDEPKPPPVEDPPSEPIQAPYVVRGVAGTHESVESCMM